MLSSAKFVTDGTGKRVAVQIDIEEYERMLEMIEDLDDVRAAEEAKALNDEAIPLRQAIAEIEQSEK